MDILNTLKSAELYIILGLVVVVLILIIMNIVLLKAVNKVENKYRKFMRGVNGKNLEELVVKYLDNVDDVKKDTETMKELCLDIDKKVKGCIQKTSILRYKAFEDVGSDLSFSIVLLDDSDNGFILTGIYGRNDSTTYAKPIDKGISRYDLSDEEKEVLQNAMNQNK